MERLLTRGELERQEIYLASPEQLNDPMEGYRDFFWLGDAVLWRNLFRHYVMCLVHSTVIALILDDETWRLPEIPVSASLDDLPSDQMRGIALEAIGEFVSDAGVARVLTHLAGLDVRLTRDGVLYHLRSVHLIAFRAVAAALQQQGGPQLLRRPTGDFKYDAGRGLDELEAALAEVESSARWRTLDAVHGAANHVAGQSALVLSYNNRREPGWQRKAFLISEYPGLYLDELSRSLVHPPWRAACFSATCTNASMWGTYGDSHTGAALKFVCPGSPPRLRVRAATGVAGSKTGDGVPTYSNIDSPLHQVEYTRAAPEVDFFRFLGTLPWPRLNRTWIRGDNGETSERLAEAFSDLDAWRAELWKLFHDASTCKLSDWAHEEEYRIVHTDTLGLGNVGWSMEYEFSSLIGIVFGLAATERDKLEVMEVVERKCAATDRNEFEFHQVRYDHGARRLYTAPLRLLKFANSEWDK